MIVPRNKALKSRPPRKIAPARRVVVRVPPPPAAVKAGPPVKVAVPKGTAVIWTDAAGNRFWGEVVSRATTTRAARVKLTSGPAAGTVVDSFGHDPDNRTPGCYCLASEVGAAAVKATARRRPPPMPSVALPVAGREPSNDPHVNVAHRAVAGYRTSKGKATPRAWRLVKSTEPRAAWMGQPSALVDEATGTIYTF